MRPRSRSSSGVRQLTTKTTMKFCREDPEEIYLAKEAKSSFRADVPWCEVLGSTTSKRHDRDHQTNLHSGTGDADTTGGSRTCRSCPSKPRVSAWWWRSKPRRTRGFSLGFATRKVRRCVGGARGGVCEPFRFVDERLTSRDRRPPDRSRPLTVTDKDGVLDGGDGLGMGLWIKIHKPR